MTEKYEIEYVSIDKLKPAEYNPRKLTKEKEGHLTESIKKFGLVDPIIVNKAQGRENVIIGGHQRYYVARNLGYTTVPVVYLEIIDIEKEKELNLRLNKNTGEWDFELLKGFNKEFLQNIGFSEADLIPFENIEIIEYGGLDSFEKDNYKKPKESIYIIIADITLIVKNKNIKEMSKKIKPYQEKIKDKLTQEIERILRDEILSLCS